MRLRQPPAVMPPQPESTAETPEKFRPSWRAQLAGTVLVAAVYVYFLIFAQFGFLRALTTALGEGHAWFQAILLAMAAAGIGGGFAAARFFSAGNGRGLVRAGLVVAAAAAGLTWVAATPAVFLVAALATGAGTGLTTVALAGVLRAELGEARLGVSIGLATGAAYALCNLPAFFRGELHTQLLLAFAAAGTGLAAVQGLEQRAPREAGDGPEYSPLGRWRWIAIFLVLILTDSAVFYVVQQTPALKQATWGPDAQLWLNAGAHLAGGVLAGLALHRRHLAGTVLVSALLLAAAGMCFGSGVANSALAVQYSLAVSGYCAVLVYYPARRAQPGLAAWLYGIAGWLGSGLGLGLAEGLQRIPPWLPLAAGGLVAALLAVRPRR